MDEKPTEDKPKRKPHLISVPNSIYKALVERGGMLGLSPGEMNKAVLRCWIEGKPAPRFEVIPPKPAEVVFVAPAVAQGAAAAPPARPAAVPDDFAGAQAAHVVERAPETERQHDGARATGFDPPDIDFDNPTSAVLAEAQRLLSGGR